MVSSLVCVLVMGDSAVTTLRTGNYGAMGMTMVVPMVTVAIMHLVPFLQWRRTQRAGCTGYTGGTRWRARWHHRGRRPGWRRNKPGPAMILLAVATRPSMFQTVRDSRPEGSTPVSAA